MALELEDIGDSASIEVRRQYICADCGTLASTNSAKHFVQQHHDEEQLTRAEAERLAEEEDMAVDIERGVRLRPPCPCGCNVFNTTEVLAVHYEDQQTPLPRRDR